MERQPQTDNIPPTMATSTNDTQSKLETPKGVQHPGVIDFLAYRTQSGEVLLKMFESRPWGTSKEQMFQLQDKLNAYFSFILDGEMADTYPQFKDKPVRITLECATPPEGQVLQFLQTVYDQANLQGISFEVDVVGGGCACGSPENGCGNATQNPCTSA
ncbi:MAG: hypothetical protein RLZZ399_1398 [Verrucomicrobiota bacterium]